MDRTSFRREKLERRTDQNLVRKSEETILRKRKSKLEDYFMKRRISVVQKDYGISLESLISDENKREQINQMVRNIKEVRNPIVYRGLLSENPNTIRLSLYLLSNFLNYSIKEKDYFKDFFSEKIVDKLCDYCSIDDKDIQYESSKILINLTCLEEEVSQRLLNFPENLKKLTALNIKKDFILIEHFIRIFFNMTIDTIYYLNDLLKTGIIDLCLEYLELPEIPTVLVIEINKLLQKLIKENKNIEKVKQIIFVNAKLLNEFDDLNLAISIIKTFTLFDISETLITCLIDAKITKKLINFCESNIVILQKLSLGLVGNMLTGNDIHAHIFIQFGVLKTYYFLLNESIDNEVLQSTLLGISNLCDRIEITKKIIEMDIFQKIITIFSNLVMKKEKTNEENNVLKECIYCIRNAVIETFDKVKVYFLEIENTDIILALMFSLEYFMNKNDSSIVYLILEIMNSFLDIDETTYNSEIKTLMINYNLDKIINLLINCENEDIEKICSVISDKIVDDSEEVY